MFCTYKPRPGPLRMQIWNGVTFSHWKAVQRADRLFVDRQAKGAPIMRPEMAIGVSDTGANLPLLAKGDGRSKVMTQAVLEAVHVGNLRESGEQHR